MKEKGIVFKEFWSIGPRRLGDIFKLLEEKFSIILPTVPREQLLNLSQMDMANLLYQHNVFSEDEVERFALVNIVRKWRKRQKL